MTGLKLYGNAQDKMLCNLHERLEEGPWEGEYFQVEFAEGLTFVWDTWSYPYLIMDRDSPYYVSDPARSSLADYPDDGMEIDTFLYETLRMVDLTLGDIQWDMSNSCEYFLLWDIHLFEDLEIMEEYN